MVIHYLSQVQQLVSPLISCYNSIKIVSVRGIQIFFFKFLIFQFLRLLSLRSFVSQRICLSLNIRSSEYENLRKFSKTYCIGMFLTNFFSLNWDLRNRLFLEAKSFEEVLVAVIFGKLSKVKYIYVGLSGARLVKRFVETPHENFKIHVVHGRNTGKISRFDAR